MFHHGLSSFVVTDPGRGGLSISAVPEKLAGGRHHETIAAKTSCSAAQRDRFRATSSWPVVLLAR